MPQFRKQSRFHREWLDGKHRFEHWYRDNTVYFITSKCNGGFAAFDSENAKRVFWDRFEHWTAQYGFVPWVTTLMNNHYHTLGYLKIGEDLGPMMQRFHGSVAKLTNDLLPERLKPFWRTNNGNDYFDGCLRDEKQCRRAYGYTLRQSVRARIVRDWKDYPHTRVRIDLERGLRRAHQLNAFLAQIRYPRYDGRPTQPGRAPLNQDAPRDPND